MSPRPILVALDSSPRAPAVLDAALALAGSRGAKVILLRAVGLPPDVPTGAFGLSPGGVEDLLLEDARKALGDMALRVPPPLLAESLVELGTPWRAICDAAQKCGADLIVLGSHGYGGLDRLLGTTAAKVVNHADCSVWVVRPPRA